MFPGLNPKKVQAMMKQMGIGQEEIPAKQVIIRQEDKNIIIENPSVVKINMQGQESFQISGDVSEEEKTEDNEDEDIKTIAEKTGCSQEEAREALDKANGDLTEAILNIKKNS
jgi:nascent polypeptide-associated complex subunit alpha